MSRPPYATANLALSSDDDRGAVLTNRRRLADALGLRDPSEWWWLRQVHGGDTVVAGATAPPATPPMADAVVTATPGVPMTVLTADCAPIAIARDGAAGVVHAGWRGLLAGVADHAVARLRELAGGAPAAVIGPCIHPCCYEFGPDDLRRLTDRFGAAVAAETDDGRPALDLPAAARGALERAGVTDVTDVGVCTATSEDHFSHRRDGVTGRQALVVVLDE